MKRGALVEKIELWGFEKDFAIFRDGSIGFSFELIGADISSSADDTINTWTSRIGSFLNGLPPHLDLQFVQSIESGNSEKLSEFKNRAGGASSSLVQDLAQARVDCMSELDGTGAMPVHRMYLVVRKAPSSATPKKSIFTSAKKFVRLSETQLALEIEQTKRLQTQIDGELSRLGLSPRRLDAREVASLSYRMWNPSGVVSLSTIDFDEVAPDLISTDVEVTPKGFRIGETHFRVISLKSTPEQTVSGMAASLNALPFGSKCFLSIHVPDQAQEIEKLQRSRRVAHSMVTGKKAGVSDLDSIAKLQDLESLLEEMIGSSEKVYRTSLTVVLSDTDQSRLDENTARTLLAIRHLNGAEAMVETLAAFDIFSELSLPNARSRERERRMKTSNLSDLIPVFAPWRGHKEPAILLRNREGALLSFNPFDSNLTNSNQLISGGSGAGKSFMTNLLLLQMLKDNPKVFFVDIGGSYKKLSENLDGQYVALGVESGFSFNPFDLASGETAPSSQKIKFIVTLVELMTKEEGELRLPKLHRAEIEDAITHVYDNTAQPRLSTLKDILAAHPDAEIRRYARILAPWCGDTPYGRFIDRPTNLELTRSVVAFDLKGLESYPDLQTVCLFIITDFVWRVVARDRATMKFLVFDECWRLLKNDSGLVFIEEVFRTFRKYRASAIAISQDMDDFAKSKIASAILPNCSVKWCLTQGQIDYGRLQETLSLNDNEVALVKSLRQEKGFFSEAFLVANDNHTVAVIESTPLEYWIATTDPKDLAEIDRAEKEYPGESSFERLQRLAQNFPNGVAASSQTSKSKGGEK
ncbi:MAG: ATP-binding protein [Bdellovibrionales bacterium]|nr:ATP-binding protein [Bdellovibrionales bacterium]